MSHPQPPLTVNDQFLAEALVHIMAQNEDLKLKLDAHHAATSDALSAVQVQIQQVSVLAQRLLELQSEIENNTLTQEQADRLAADTQALVNATERMAADDEPEPA